MQQTIAWPLSKLEGSRVLLLFFFFSFGASTHLLRKLATSPTHSHFVGNGMYIHEIAACHWPLACGRLLDSVPFARLSLNRIAVKPHENSQISATGIQNPQIARETKQKQPLLYVLAASAAVGATPAYQDPIRSDGCEGSAGGLDLHDIPQPRNV